MAATNQSLWDGPTRYGTISRVFHWSMVALMMWQFLTAIAHFFLSENNPVRSFFWQSHYTMGTLLFILVILRGLWGMLNLTHRPTLESNFLGLAGRLGHLALYVLMFLVPLLALLRAYGSGRGFSFFSIQIFAPSPDQSLELVAAGNKFHGELGWLLLLLIIGHIAMVYVHRLVLKDGIDKRMSRSR